MNWLDWVLLVSLGFSVVSGLMSGLMKTIFGLAGFIVGLWLAGHYYATLAPKLGFISQENMAKIVAFVIIAAAVILVAYILGAIFRKIISLLTLGWVDRLGGAILGLALSIIFLGAGLALVTKFPVLNLEQAIGNSWIASLLLKTYPLVRGLLPSEFSSLGSLFP